MKLKYQKPLVWIAKIDDNSIMLDLSANGATSGGIGAKQNNFDADESADNMYYQPIQHHSVWDD